MNRIPFNYDALTEMPLVSLDVETDGLHWYRDQTFGIAMAACDPVAGVIMSQYVDIRENPRAVTILKRIAPKIKKYINFNAKFDAHFLMNDGIDIPLDRMECSSVRAALINEHEPSFALDELCQKYIERGKPEGIYEELAAIFGGKPTRSAQMKNLHKAPSSLAGKYATPDPELAILLWLWQEEEIARQDLHQVWDLERRLTPVLVRMERQGVRVDVERTEASMVTADQQIAQNQRLLDKMAGVEVNVNSPPQVRRLFKVEKGEDGKWRTHGMLLDSTDGGEASMNADALRSLTERGHPEAEKVLAVRKMVKAKSFLKDHILGHQIKGRVYPSYNQTRGDNSLGTGTGRLSVNDPALQQIPSRDKEVAEIVRSCFVPEIGHRWLSMDYSQMEFRVFAHYVGEPKIYQMYEDDPNTDFHQAVAELTGLPRSPRFAGDPNAKMVNLSLVFGAGPGKTAESMGMEYTVSVGKNGREYLIPGEKAIEVFNQYHAAVPGVKALLDKASSIARSRGYVKTIMGRHIRFPNGKAVHKAAGLVFQGSSADAIKLKMIEFDEKLAGTDIRMLISVHDELGHSVPVGGELTDDMVRWYTTFDGIGCPIAFKVPITCDASYGDNWYMASK